jgi:hypothetical protein
MGELVSILGGLIELVVIDAVKAGSQAMLRVELAQRLSTNASSQIPM